MRKREKKAFVSFFFAKLCVRNEIFTFQSQKLLKNSRVESQVNVTLLFMKEKRCSTLKQNYIIYKKVFFYFSTNHC